MATARPPSYLNTAKRLLLARSSAWAPIILISLVGVLRLLIERGTIHVWASDAYPHILAQFVSFYPYSFHFHCLILVILLRREYSRVINIASIGLAFGIFPPIIHSLLFAESSTTFVYFREWSWTLIHEAQSPAESIVLWSLILATGAFVWWISRSYWRALAASFGSYLYVHSLYPLSHLTLLNSDSQYSQYWENAALAWLLLGASFLIYSVLNPRVLRWLARALIPTAVAALGFMIARSGHTDTDWRQWVVPLALVALIALWTQRHDSFQHQAGERRITLNADDRAWFLFHMILALIALYSLRTLPVILTTIALLVCGAPNAVILKRERLVRLAGCGALLAAIAVIDGNLLPTEVLLSSRTAAGMVVMITALAVRRWVWDDPDEIDRSTYNAQPGGQSRSAQRDG